MKMFRVNSWVTQINLLAVSLDCQRWWTRIWHG